MAHGVQPSVQVSVKLFIYIYACISVFVRVHYGCGLLPHQSSYITLHVRKMVAALIEDAIAYRITCMYVHIGFLLQLKVE